MGEHEKNGESWGADADARWNEFLEKEEHHVPDMKGLKHGFPGGGGRGLGCCLPILLVWRMVKWLS